MNGRPDISIAQGDVLPSVKSTLTWPDGTAVDLTDATIAFELRPMGQQTPVTSGAANAVGDPTLGAVQYDWQTSDTDQAGDFDARFVVAFIDGRQASFPNDHKLWVRVDTPIGDGGSPSAGGFTPFVPSVADLTELGTVTSTLYGQTYRVVTLRAWFYLDPSSTTPEDGITFIDAAGGGSWFRVGPGDTFWQLQTSWFYDNADGDDEATGLDVSHPVKTIAEIWRRTMGAALLTDVTITVAGGSLTDDEAAVFEAMAADSPRQWSLA